MGVGLALFYRDPLRRKVLGGETQVFVSNATFSGFSSAGRIRHMFAGFVLSLMIATSVIATATNTVIKSITVAPSFGVAVTPDGSKA